MQKLETFGNLSTEILITIPIKESDKQQANEVKEG